MTKPKVSIVIPNYNGIKLLEENLPFVVKAYDNPKNNIREVIVVDDASDDNSVEFIKQNYPKIRVIVQEKNKRFAETSNNGFKNAKSDLVCLINNDVKPSEGFLSNSTRLFEDESVFGVSLAEKGHSWAKGLFINGFVEHKPGKATNVVHSTFWISGGSGIFRKNMWSKLKGLDSKLYKPFYWEDTDISYRAMKRGWKLLWDPSAKTEHFHESTNKLFDNKYRSRIQERNQLIFIWKNITSPRMFRQHIKNLIGRTLRHPGYVIIVIMAMAKIRWIIPARLKEKKETKISDESIFEMS